MKLAVISDIHGNLHALKACVEYFQKENCDEYLFLGDYVSDTPYPRETMDFLYSFIDNHICFLLRGNREDYMLSHKRVCDGLEEGPEWIANSASGNLLYTYERLTPKDFEFFEKLPISMIYHKEGYPSITCCHGSPDNNRELVQFSAPNAIHWLDAIDTEIMVCGHTHFPGELRYNGKSYFNCGSAGIAICDRGMAQCLILKGEEGKWKPEFLKIKYDVDKVISDIFTSGLHNMGKWFVNANIQTLATGIDHAGEMIRLASDLVKRDGDSTAVWPYIDEKYYCEAAKRLGIPNY